MADTNGSAATVEIDLDPAVFQDFADLEKEFAKAELEALRQKEFAMRNLYTHRNVLCSKIPNFWPAVLMNGPQEFQSILNDSDVETLGAVKSLNVERYQITSGSEGEPRSLRFTFEFDTNEWFEDTTVVKEFEWRDENEEEGKVGGLVSKPVTLKWTKKGKKLNTGLLDLALDLYKAEETVKLKDGKSGRDLEVVDREGLWQYEKLRARLEKLEADPDGEMEAKASWLDWFGYRGVVGSKKQNGEAEKTNGKAENDEDEDEDMELDEDDGMLDVEVFPGGEAVATALADDLWPNVMDYFMASQQEPIYDEFDGLDSDEDDLSDDEDEPPELVPAEEARPAKRQRKA